MQQDLGSADDKQKQLAGADGIPCGKPPRDVVLLMSVRPRVPLRDGVGA